jgi:3-oxoacyl-[acyl-carrier protein] reductase
VAADLSSEDGRKKLLRAFPDADILVNNAGGPPTGDFREFAREDWIKALDACMIGPIDMIRATIDGVSARRFGRIVNVTSYSVKMPIDLLCLSNGARAGLTGFIAGLARQEATVSAAAKSRGISFDEARQQKMAAIPAGRMGEPEEFGDLCAWLCSARAGSFTGQNVLLDGGLYPGIF